MARFPVYATASLMAVAAVVYHAQVTRVQFYPTVVYLTTSKLSIALIGNLLLVLAYAFGKLLKSAFFGPLNSTEYDVRVPWRLRP